MVVHKKFFHCRCLQLYKTKNYKIAFKTYKAMLPVGSQIVEEHEDKVVFFLLLIKYKKQPGIPF